jgi:hypothetical protein
MLRLFLGLFIVAGVAGNDDYTFALNLEPTSIYINIVLAVFGLLLMQSGVNEVRENHG